MNAGAHKHRVVLTHLLDFAAQHPTRTAGDVVRNNILKAANSDGGGIDFHNGFSPSLNMYILYYKSI
jgi:hypothetical protein